jgi:hypothetical protein
MGKIGTLASSCTKGVSMWGVSAKIVDKYLLALDMALRDPDEWLRDM